MADRSEDDEPRRRNTRWKKGQSGNPKRRYVTRRNSSVEWTSKLLGKPVEITLYGVTTKIPTLEAIVTVVSLRALAGDPRALALQMKFKEFAARRSQSKVQIEFVDNDYTRSLAAPNSTVGGN